MKGRTLVLIVLAGVLAAAGPLSAEDVIQVPAALIQELTGTVEIRRPGDSLWTPAVAGMRLEPSSLISTGLQSSAQLLIGQSKVMVRPLTRLSIEELSALRDTEQVGLFLRTGKVRVEVSPPENGRTNFTVRSPQAVNSVRGTVFEFDTVHLAVEGGRVWFAPSAGGSAALVRGGESSAYVEETTMVQSPHSVLDKLRPELPPGTENGAVVPSAVPGPVILPAASGPVMPPSVPGPAVEPPPDLDADITIGW